VLKPTPIPNSLQRRDLIVVRTFVGLQRVARISADRVSIKSSRRFWSSEGSKPSTGMSRLFVYSGGVWQPEQPACSNTSFPRLAVASKRFGFCGGRSEYT
jgi:hypothetical protein